MSGSVGSAPVSRLLIEGGRILSFDPAVGDLEQGSLLVEDGRIAEVGSDGRRRRRRAPGRHGLRGHARLRGHPPAHLADGAARALRGLDAHRLLPRRASHVLAPLHGGGRVRGEPRRSARGAGRGRDHDPRLLPLHEHPGARRRRRGGPPRRRWPRRLRLRLLPDGGPRAGVRDPGGPDPGRAPGARASLLLARRPAHHGRGPHRDGTAPVRGHARRDRLGAGARRAAHRAHRVRLGLAGLHGSARDGVARAAGSGPGARALQRPLGRGARNARPRRSGGVLHARDGDADGDGPAGDPALARSGRPPLAGMRRDLVLLGGHVRPDAARPPVPALHGQRRLQRPRGEPGDDGPEDTRRARVGHHRRRGGAWPGRPHRLAQPRASRPT